jgi:hypothetical protein
MEILAHPLVSKDFHLRFQNPTNGIIAYFIWARFLWQAIFAFAVVWTAMLSR